MGRDELLDRIERDGKNDDIGFLCRVVDGHDLGLAAKLAGELLRLYQVSFGDDDALPACRKVFCDARADISKSDDGGFHGFAILSSLVMRPERFCGVGRQGTKSHFQYWKADQVPRTISQLRLTGGHRLRSVQEVRD